MRYEELQALIAYRMKRAIESLEEARLMQNTNHWNTCSFLLVIFHDTSRTISGIRF